MPDIITPIKCRHCTKTFLPPAEPMDLLNPTKEWVKLTMALTKHLAAKHPNDLGAAQQAGGELAGVLALLNFEIHDGEFQKQADYVRWKCHQITTRAKVTDERIRERVNQVLMDAGWPPNALRERTETVMVALLCEMRDVLEERGLYPVSGPVKGEKAPVVTIPGAN